jgi:DNA-binding GntR family transcriptional regulator
MYGDFDDSAVIDRTSISDQVYFHIKKMILSGELTGGKRIPEERIAEHFRVSRTPVREAIRKLAAYGLVVIKPRSYAYVATLSPKEARDITEVRLSLEKLSFRLFAQVRTEEKLGELRRISESCIRANQSADLASAHELDSRLHLEIARATENEELFRMLGMLDAKLQLLRLKQSIPPDRLYHYFSQHEILLKHLASGDVSALDALLDEHIVHDLDPVT